MEDLAYSGHKFPNLVLTWRQLSKLKNTYSDALQTHINSKTKRVHTSFLLAATNTGRLASSDPNLQNIPIKTEDGKEIRKAFLAEKNNLLTSADYSQIEMRILADLADVKELKKAFKNNEDVHSITASQVFNMPIKKISEDLRRKAKAINFGIIYGVSAFGLSNQTDLNIKESKTLIETYYEKYPKLKQFIEKQIFFAREKGYVETILGRRRVLRDINSSNSIIKSAAERNAVNAPIQGSAADIIKMSMINIQKNLFQKKSRVKCCYRFMMS